MIGIVLVTHGNLALEFRRALEHVVGEQSQFETLSIGPEDDMEKRKEDVLTIATSVDTGSGTIILTDMFGGTPSNLATSIMSTGKFEVIAGVNLPLLIKLAGIREKENMSTVIEKSIEAGKRYINVASQVETVK